MENYGAKKITLKKHKGDPVASIRSVDVCHKTLRHHNELY